MADSVSPLSWRRVLLVLLYLLLGLLLVDGLVILLHPLWDRYDQDVYRHRIRAARKQQWDLLAVGGSPVSEGLDVRRLVGLTHRGHPVRHAFNAGLPGATTAETWLAVRHAITDSPRVLIYGITATDLNSGRKEPSGVHALVDLADLKRWWGNRPSDREWAVRHFLQARFGEAWQLQRRAPQFRQAAAEWAEATWPGCCPESARLAREDRLYRQALDGPYAPRPSLARLRLDASAEVRAGMAFTYLDRFSLQGYLPYLHAIIDRAERLGADLYLVDMPVTEELEGIRYPEIFAQYRATLADVARERGGRVIWASRQAVGLEVAHFADLIHLNEAGSQRLADWVRRQLEDPYPFTARTER